MMRITGTADSHDDSPQPQHHPSYPAGLTLHQTYAAPDVINRLAPGATSRTLCDGQWIVLPGLVLGFITVGPGPHTSHFRSASRFRWVADKRYHAADDPDARMAFLPDEVRAGKQPTRPIFLFARPTPDGQFTFVGRLGPCHSYGYYKHSEPGHADFDLLTTLPSDVWRSLGGRLRRRPTPAQNAALRGVLTRPPTAPVAERLATLSQLIDYWHGPLSDGDGYTDQELAGLPIANPLRWWFRRGGRRKGILDGFNQLLDPAELELDDHGRVTFLVECQAVYLWSTQPTGEDPPMWGRLNGDDDPWRLEEPTLSAFLIQSCIFEALNQAPYGAIAGRIDQATLDAVTAPCSLIPLGAWRWPCYPSRFWVGDGVFVYASADQDEPEPRRYGLYVGALTEHPLAYLKPLVTPRWEYTAL